MKFKVTITTTKQKVKIVKADSLEAAIEVARAGGGKLFSRSGASRSFHSVYANPADDPTIQRLQKSQP